MAPPCEVAARKPAEFKQRISYNHDLDHVAPLGDALTQTARCHCLPGGTSVVACDWNWVLRARMASVHGPLR